jgi:alpha-galactosidase
MGFEVIDELPVDRQRGRVFEHGWQSWSPSTTYPAGATSYRPVQPAMDLMCYRPCRPAPAYGFQAEGLLALDPGDGGPVRRYAAVDGVVQVPSIRASIVDTRMVVTADGPTAGSTHPDLADALISWADGFALTAGAPPPRPPPTVWCSWYHYYADVTEADVVENLERIAELELPVDVVQIDDGWQAEIGDWLSTSDRFGSLPGIVERIRDSGRRAGIWVAPFLVGARSRLAREHPDWLLGAVDPSAGASCGKADAGHNWDQDLYALDTTHPSAAEYLHTALRSLCDLGFDYFKLDFLYAGALAGRRYGGVPELVAYRDGLRQIRAAIGPAPYLTGSGAPILPSVGLVDAMRVGPDIGPRYEPDDGDASRPAQHSATLSTVGRAFQHGRFWVNDSDCLIARPAVERREDWAEVVARYGGLRSSSDRIAELDDWGLATTRRLLSQVPPPTPFPAVP